MLLREIRAGSLISAACRGYEWFLIALQFVLDLRLLLKSTRFAWCRMLGRMLARKLRTDAIIAVRKRMQLIE